MASRGGERKTRISSSSYEGTNLVRLGPCCLNSFKPLPPPLRPYFQIQSHWELGLSCMSTGGLGDMNTETITMTESSCLQDTPYGHHKIRRKLGPVFFKHGSLGTTDFSFKHPSRKGCASLVGSKIKPPEGTALRVSPCRALSLSTSSGSHIWPMGISKDARGKNGEPLVGVRVVDKGERLSRDIKCAWGSTWVSHK